jgi:hypothetical protein
MLTGLYNQRRALQETKDVFPALKERIADAVEKLKNLLVS